MIADVLGAISDILCVWLAPTFTILGIRKLCIIRNFILHYQDHYIDIINIALLGSLQVIIIYKNISGLLLLLLLLLLYTPI